MELTIKYKYSQKFYPTKRHKIARENTLEDSIVVNIREIELENFPVAFIIHDMKSIVEGMTSYSDYDNKKSDFRMFSEEIRTFNGKLYSPIRITHGAAISTLFEKEDCIICLIAYSVPYKWHRNSGEAITEKSILIENDKEEICNEIVEYSDRFIFCDGKFWTECGEPVYKIQTFGLGNNHGSTGFFIEYARSYIDEGWFNALQREEAIAYGKSVALGRGDTNSVDRMGEFDIIEVVMPEMVKVKPRNIELEEN